MTTQQSSIDREEIARQRLLIQENQDAPAQLREAVDYFISAGLPQEARGPLERLRELQSDDVTIRLMLGAVYAESGEVENAEQAFVDATHLAPNSAEVYHNLAVLYCATGQVDKARQQFETILHFDPENPEALNDLAVLYAATERSEEALALYERCLNSKPTYKKCWDNALQFVFAAGHFAKGIEWISRLLIANPGDTQLAEWRQKFIRALPDNLETERAEADRQFIGRQSAEELVAPPEEGKVSIIIPTYNAGKALPSTIESVLTQSYSPIEIIVVDDGSLDKTAEITKAYGNRMAYIGRVHSGWAAAANEGIQQSRGQWIILLEPGDVLLPEAIATTVAWFRAHPEHDVVYCPDNRPTVAEISGKNLPMFQRDAFVRFGFFAETANDPFGDWSRRLKSIELEQLAKPGKSENTWFLQRSERTSARENQKYYDMVFKRWQAEIEVSRPKPTTPPRPVVQTPSRTGLEYLLIGADDPGGIFASYARAINKYTAHHCRVLVHKTRLPVDPQLVMTLPDKQNDNVGFERQVQELANNADGLIFAAGLGAGAVRRDGRLADTDEVPFGNIDWRFYSKRKKCAAFLCSSPAVRGNYHWYQERFAERGWPVLASSPDICLHVPDAHFVPPLIDWTAPEYTRADYSVGPVSITFHERLPYAGGRHGDFVPLIGQLKNKYGDQVLFGRCVEMTQRETLLFRQRIHIGFDRLSFGAPRFGLTSLENSALGLVNIVYLDQFSKALIANTLGTDQLPWLTPDSSYALYDLLDLLISEQDDLARRMKETAEWFRRFWAPEKMVQRLTSILMNL